MKVFVVEYRDWSDCELIGVFTSAAIAEKYIEKSIRDWCGDVSDISKYRDRYYVSIEDVIGE